MKTEINRQTMLGLAMRACETMMRKFAPEDLPPKGHFHYHQGVFLSGMYKTYELCGEEKYFAYIKAWVDSILDPYGDITSFNPGQLDDLQPCVLLFPLLKATGDTRYRDALDTIAYYISTFPHTKEGGFWHKAWYHEQMWLDGLYMAGPFSVEYGATFGRRDLIESAVFQAKMMREKTRDARTGLWYHAWDATRRQPWADPATGRSPEFWGRSMGWVPVALLEEYELLQPDDPAREALAEVACDLLRALCPWQDEKTGLWYQVVNKGDRPENWHEISCSCLYVAALCRAVRLGLMDEGALEIARKGCAGVVESLQEAGDDLLIGGVCVGTGVGDYAHYCARPVSVNDLHGVGAFLLMCAETAKAF